MLESVKAAAVKGLVAGVQMAVATLIVLFAVSWFLGDYAITKQRALNGQRAFEALSAIKKAQQPIPAGVAQ